MALAHPSFQNGSGKLALKDAEDAWFVRVNHITGTAWTRTWRASVPIRPSRSSL
jgi:hypothetical protein